MSPYPRRTFLRTSTLAPVALLLGCGGSEPASRDQPPRTLAATPACEDGDEPTLEQTEGPYFTPGSPERRTLLEPGIDGTRLALAGRVLSTDCRPVRRALLDFWQADAGGEYDTEGFRLRGHQFTDARGRFALETVVPGLYPGRTRHLHVRVQAPRRDVLATQLYFPDEPENDADGIFAPELVMAVRRAGARRVAAFDFVLAA